MSKGLSLDVSMSKDDDVLGSTFRQGGLSVGGDHMRLFGEDVPLEVSITDLVFGSKIGQGACSTVKIATHKRTGERYAVKMFNVYDEKQAQQLYNEILLLTSFQCDALIGLKGAFHDEGSIGVILEFMDRGSLEFLCETDYPLEENVMGAIAFQMIWGLGFLHYERQIHRDIKPGNALMNSEGQVKLSDFGISKELENTAGFSNTAIGSFRYMSPERLLAERYDASGDIWSVGMTLLELWNKEYPFKVRSPIELSTYLQHFDLRKYLKGTSRHFFNFIDCMLKRDPQDRWPCLELTRHAWFSELRITSLEDAQQILATWLRRLDKSKQGRSDAHSIAYAERGSSDIGGPRSYVGNAQKPPRTLSAAVIKESIHEMSMSMSMTHDEMIQLRAHNPFNASGSLSGSSNSNLLSFNPGPKIGGSNNRPHAQHKGIDEDEEYESDFEDQDVEPYRDEGKSNSRTRQRSPDYYHSSVSSSSSMSPFNGQSGSNSNSRSYRK